MSELTRVVDTATEIELAPKPCPDCGEIMTAGRSYGGRFEYYIHEGLCAIAKEKKAEKEAAERRKYSIEMLFKHAKIPRGSVELTKYTSRYAIDNGNQDACQTAARWVRAFKKEGKVPASGFALIGPPGAGKSILAACAVRSMIEDLVSVLWWNVPYEIGLIRSSWDKDDDQEYLIKQLTKPYILVLDDLGREKPAAWVVDQILYPVMESRLARRLPIIVTTNETRQTLGDRYSAAAYRDGTDQSAAAAMLSRLDALIACWVPMTGPDRRKADAAWMTKETR